LWQKQCGDFFWDFEANGHETVAQDEPRYPFLI
jgi:hypothetical protein